ncbi:ATP-binding protein [Desulfonatronovibrio magnus]|uniref:ATP-binding protein n=1 Tax=Desulfonatronovibrio magnus TaxID=698827 RepID=UPI0005EB043B|nr:ATP-binding protein [Desulfonatronovibrio magnus]
MYKNRQIFSRLEEQSKNNKITLLIGARQVGKTTLLSEIYRRLPQDCPKLFLDLDVYSNYEKVSTYENCLNILKLNGYKPNHERRFFLFLDEFQRYSDISLVLKNLADHHPDVKIFASGSSSLAINERVQESLAGRKRTVRVYPLSFKEYLEFVDQSELLEKVNNISGVKSKNLKVLVPEVFTELEKFMIYGGYPEVAQVQDQEKEEVLASIFDLYVKKDLVDFLALDRIKHAKTLIQHLAINNGQETPYSQLAQVASINEKTAKNYVEILRETFIITVHTPFFTNRNKELVKTPKIYFLDNGVRNYFLNNFNGPQIRPDASFLFEGFVISELIKNGFKPDRLKFWRTKNRQEVDLVLNHDSGPVPVEIKYKSHLKVSDFQGLFTFCENYSQSQGLYLINPYNNQPSKEVCLLSPFELEGLNKFA